MITKLKRSGDDVVLVLDEALLQDLGLDENSEVEVSTDGKVLIVAPTRAERFRKAMDEINRPYDGVFRRLSDS